MQTARFQLNSIRKNSPRREPLVRIYPELTIPRIQSLYLHSRNFANNQPKVLANMGPAPTHFLCLPLITETSIPQLELSLAHFKISVTTSPEHLSSNDNARLGADTDEHDQNQTSRPAVPKSAFPKAAFRPLGVLHLTLGVMGLRDPQRLEAALKLLHEIDLKRLLSDAGNQVDDNSAEPKNTEDTTNTIKPQVPSTSEQVSAKENESASSGLQTLKSRISPPPLSRPTDPPPLIISLKGLEFFGKPQKATVLHVPPHDPTSRLRPFSFALRQRFIDAGFMEPETRPLTLHATIFNTVYAKSRKEQRGEKRRIGRILVDATDVLRIYQEEAGGVEQDKKGQFVWAEGIEIDRVMICEMGAKNIEDERLRQEYVVAVEKLILS